MTTRRIGPRTPRRRKAWAHRETSIVLGATTSSPKLDDLLAPYYADLGSGPQGGLTVMRIVGRLGLTDWISGAVTPEYETVRIGFAWVDKNVGAAPDGDAQIPVPLQDGSRDTKWIQQIYMKSQEQPTSDVSVERPSIPMLDGISFKDVDITQQRKQPSASSVLALVIAGGIAFEANTTVVSVSLDILLALP